MMNDTFIIIYTFIIIVTVQRLQGRNEQIDHFQQHELIYANEHVLSHSIA